MKVLSTRRQESRRLEARIALILRMGVIAAAALLTVSLPWLVIQGGSRQSAALTAGRRKHDRLYLALTVLVCLIVAGGALFAAA